MREFYVETTDSFVLENETQVIPVTMTRTVRGEKLVIHGEERVIIKTGEIVFDWDVAQKNSEMLFTQYSELHGLMASEEAKGLRVQLKVSKKEFANLVGVPEITIVQIETGSLISDESNKLLRDFKEVLATSGKIK